MKFKPGIESLETDNVNVSHSSPVREFVTLLLGAFGILALIYAVSGLLIDKAVDWIDPKTEKALFSDLYNAFDDAESQTDASVTLQRLVDDLQQCLDPGYEITVNLTEDSSPNAFALPGGKMVVTQGLLDLVSSENGLAFVLAHELAHFANRDHLRGIGRGIVLAAMSAAVLGSDSGLDAIFAPASLAGQARFSRSRESQADQRALMALNCHYAHIGGATEFFEGLKRRGDAGDTAGTISHYFASHPDAQSRVDALSALGGDSGFAQGALRELPEALQ